MKLFGITGGVGMGKSTAGQLLAQRGVAVSDTDLIARQLVEPGLPALREILQRFGPSLLSADGRLNRRELARLIFADSAARADLEAILHPRIRSIWQAEAGAWRAAGCARGAVIIPLLFETHAAPHFDAVICVACSEASRWQRLLQRGWSNAEIRRRIEAQWPTEPKIAASDFIVWTDTPLPAHAAQLERILTLFAHDSS
jgi:dephospho-CoA kinase